MSRPNGRKGTGRRWANHYRKELGLPEIPVPEDKVRLVVVVDDELRAALRLEAALRDVDMSEVVAQLLTDHLKDSLAEVRRRRASSSGGKKKPKDSE